MRQAKTWVEVSKSALLHNTKGFKRRLGKDVALMAVVKANAYGHGLLEVAKTVAPLSDAFGVDNLDEAGRLLKTGIRKPILTLGFTPSWRMKEAARLGVRMTVSTIEQVRAAKAAADAAKRDVRLHVKVETGTTRQGVDLRGLPELAAVIKGAKRLVFEGLSTHYANIEDTTDHSYASGQLETYRTALDQLEAHGIVPPMRHTACTAAAALFPDTHFTMARVGIGLYGLWPSAETRATADEKDLDLTLEPVMAWKTVIAQIKNVRRGTPVSYGLTVRMPRDGRVAVLPVGYWDGYDRGLSSNGEVLVKGHRCKVLGRVCMNMTMIDVTDVPSARAEDEVLLLGKTRQGSVPAEELASKLETISYEVVTRVNPTLPRVLV